MLIYYCEESSKLGKIIGRETQGISNRRVKKKKYWVNYLEVSIFFIALLLIPVLKKINILVLYLQ